MLETPSLLDDHSALARLDPSGMMDLVTAFLQQCTRAVSLAENIPHSIANRPVQNVVVAGMGGSAIAGDMLRCLADGSGSFPVTVWRDYGLPEWVSDKTLVIVISYSGDTEEVCSGYSAARKKGASVACIASGGQIASTAEADGIPVIRVPGGQSPRSATGYLFFPLLALASRYGLFARRMDDDISEALAVLSAMSDELGPSRPAEENPAKQLAAALHGRIPIVYGAGALSSVAAFRWKTQFNENAKVHLFAGSLPEQNHNEIVAWEQSGGQAENWSVVYLRERDESRANRIDDRVEITRKIIGRSAERHEVWSRGKSPLARLLSLIYFGDFASVYAAFLNGVDPTAIAAIHQLKSELAER